jgi:hypothetical protein
MRAIEVPSHIGRPTSVHVLTNLSSTGKDQGYRPGTKLSFTVPFLGMFRCCSARPNMDERKREVSSI